MNREQAESECARLARESPDRATHRFVPRQGAGGEWSVVKINLPPVSSEDLTAEQRADEKPSTPDDPRSAISRNLPGTFNI